MFARRAISLPKTTIRLASSQSAAAEPVINESYRLTENNPSNFNRTHIGKFYTIDSKYSDRIFKFGGIPKTLNSIMKAFNETALMVREPVVELFDFIENTDFNKPTVRYVIHGENGTGKSLTLASLLYYGAVNDFVLVHVPWVVDWFTKPEEKSISETKEGCWDINIDAAAWLIHFKTQNSTLLNKLGLICSKDYVWSPRETTKAGVSLLELVEHGILRVKFASGVIEALLNELKQQSTQGKCRTMVAIDGYNSFFMNRTDIKINKRTFATPNQITITEPFLNITNYDWCNGVCILTVDRLAVIEEKETTQYPLSLLGRRGFEYLDPFVPIPVQNYTKEEFNNQMAYYQERHWITDYGPGYEREIQKITNLNPWTLMDYVRSK